VPEVAIGRQHREIVADAKLREQRIDCTDLNAGTAASVAQFGGIGVVVPVRNRAAVAPKIGRECARR
jgi:hypothetical protein